MRKAINENPLVQAGLIGVLALTVGLLLLLRMGGSSDSSAAAPPPETTAATPAAATAPSATPAAAPTVGADSAAGAPASGPHTDFRAGPGLPKPVAAAYADDKAVVVLIVNNKGVDDRKLEQTSKALAKRSDAALFVTSPKRVAAYSRIAQGVDLDRTPALVVVRPKSLTKGPLPTAVVSYGFRGARSVEQALDNALYKGPSNLPYYPR